MGVNSSVIGCFTDKCRPKVNTGVLAGVDQKADRVEEKAEHWKNFIQILDSETSGIMEMGARP